MVTDGNVLGIWDEHILGLLLRNPIGNDDNNTLGTNNGSYDGETQ